LEQSTSDFGLVPALRPGNIRLVLKVPLNNTVAQPVKSAPWFARLTSFLTGRSPETVILAGIIGVVIMAVIDYASGPELAFSIFYFIPVCVVSWYAGRPAGMAMALLSSVAWLLAEMFWQISYSHPFVPFWNAFVRCTLFLISGALTAEVAERKRIEEALRKQTSILQSILNSMRDGVMVFDGQGEMLLYNRSAEELLGRRLEGLNADDWLQEQNLYLPDALTVFSPAESPLARALRGQTVETNEVFLRRQNGKGELWLKATYGPLVNGDGHANGGVVVFSDVSSQRTLEKQIAEISDREQRRIGQDLHDGLCQHLVSTAFAASVLRQKLETQGLKQTAEVEQIVDLLNDGITQARSLARGLYPVRLEADGLTSALEELAESVETLTDIECRITCDEPVLIADYIVGGNLFRIAQEAVNNAVKHSKAKSISIELESVEEEVTLSVHDDGIGFSARIQKHGGMGVHIMHYRARLIGASLDIRRGSNGGTTVICSFLNTNRVEINHEPSIHSH
jgi:PAS domain S-box-containing protein